MWGYLTNAPDFGIAEISALANATNNITIPAMIQDNKTTASAYDVAYIGANNEPAPIISPIERKSNLTSIKGPS